mgnify:CR=1 FL=1
MLVNKFSRKRKIDLSLNFHKSRIEYDFCQESNNMPFLFFSLKFYETNYVKKYIFWILGKIAFQIITFASPMENLDITKSATTNYQKVINLERGKIPPQAIDLEEAVLGAMMIDKKGIYEVIDVLTPQVFYKIAHQTIFAAIQKLFHDTQPIDLLTVSNELRNEGKLDLVGGDYYLVQLTQKVSSSAHIEYHARVLMEKYIFRRLIEI